ncbi:MAG TPA: PIN domain-containing protein [Aeromonadales bacterium]|nr:PIN domain-containing protein [Aeromonadales bacterium]
MINSWRRQSNTLWLMERLYGDIPDAYHAALAIETGSEWITSDQDLSRFNRLKWSSI